MEKFKIGQRVRLAVDNEVVYEIIEIHPNVQKGIRIRALGSGTFVQVSADEIVLIKG
ncbi:MAG TPA: hypothetical protein VMW01_07320 [Williamwhitmania sp.]|nr:hypothetical protein [Williamwhitmania sp.]